MTKSPTVMLGGMPIKLLGNEDGTYSIAQSAGLGEMTAVPAVSAAGTPLGTMPEGAIGARIYLAASDSITFTIKTSQPGSAPAETFTVTGNDMRLIDESLTAGAMIYVTAKTGSPLFRWY